MKLGKTEGGSITVFSVLLVLLMTGFLLSMLEGTRYNHLMHLAVLRCESGLESAFANYNTDLWKMYHLLACPKGEIEEIVKACLGEENKAENIGYDFLHSEPGEVSLEEFTLLTDGEGGAYIQAVASYMKENTVYETARLIYNRYEAIESLLKEKAPEGTEVEAAIRELERIGEAGEASKSRERSGNNTSLLEQIDRLQKTGILGLVVKDTKALSEAKLDIAEAVSQRELKKGINPYIKEAGWYEGILLQEYLLSYFHSYLSIDKSHSMAYELEYLLAGEASDVENLRQVVKELLLIREALNLAYLVTDAAKQEEVTALALTLVGVSGNPVVVEIVKLGLLAAWAFAESVLDIRALLAGKSVPLLKNPELWTMSLSNIGSLEGDFIMAKESKLGMSYGDYLGIMLFLKEDKEVAMRAMDLQELSIQKQNGGIAMDRLVWQGKIKVDYRVTSLFADWLGPYEFTAKASYSY